MRKYVDSSIGHRTPSGTYTNEPSLNTAEFSAAKKLSLSGHHRAEILLHQLRVLPHRLAEASRR